MTIFFIHAFDYFYSEKPFGKRQINFDRVYSSKTGTKRSHKDISDESSLSESNGTDNERGNMFFIVHNLPFFLFIR